MYIWKENVERVRAFYYSVGQNQEPSYLKDTCKMLMKDPDAIDEELLKEKVEQIQNPRIVPDKVTALDGDTVLSLDCVIGWKAIFDIYGGDPKWIDDYAEIRGNLNAHFLWPRHGKATINTMRYAAFRDRVDYTLYDIKLFYEEERDLHMQAAYNNPVTSKWLLFFGSFENLVKSMKLHPFCTDDYNVIDLSNPIGIINGYKDNNRTVDLSYIENLKNVLKNVH